MCVKEVMDHILATLVELFYGWQVWAVGRKDWRSLSEDY